MNKTLEMDANALIQELQLKAHPEGGYYRETFRSEQKIVVAQNGVRPTSTVIYYLLKEMEKSHFHRLKSDEAWFFHQGSTIIIEILAEGEHKTIRLGNDLVKGEVPQVILPANVWFAAKVADGRNFALVSCVVAPGFEFADFELAERGKLTTQFPEFAQLIQEFTVK